MASLSNVAASQTVVSNKHDSFVQKCFTNGNGGKLNSAFTQRLSVSINAKNSGSVRKSQKTLAMGTENGGVSSFDYDLVIIGCGVGGHGAALHAVENVQ